MTLYHSTNYLKKLLETKTSWISLIEYNPTIPTLYRQSPPALKYMYILQKNCNSANKALIR